MSNRHITDIAAKISVLQEFSHIESPLILKICEAYEKQKHRIALEEIAFNSWATHIQGYVVPYDKYLAAVMDCFDKARL